MLATDMVVATECAVYETNVFNVMALTERIYPAFRPHTLLDRQHILHLSIRAPLSLTPRTGVNHSFQQRKGTSQKVESRPI